MKRLLTYTLMSAFVVLAASCGALGVGGSGIKIGMVTDIGQLEDKSFNEYSWKGVQDGAKAVGGTATAVVTKDIADYKQNIQSQDRNHQCKLSQPVRSPSIRAIIAGSLERVRPQVV